MKTLIRFIPMVQKCVSAGWHRYASVFSKRTYAFFLAFLFLKSLNAQTVPITLINDTGCSMGPWNAVYIQFVYFGCCTTSSYYDFPQVAGGQSAEVDITPYPYPNPDKVEVFWRCGYIFVMDSQGGPIYLSGCGCSSNAPSINDNNDQPSCPTDCCGMPAWSVSEPYITLWLQDEPLGYQPTIGARISFKLAFKQRETTAGFNTNIFSVGKKWNCSWVSYVGRTNINNVVYFPGGGQRVFYATNDYLTNTRLTGDTNAGFTLAYPDGSQNIYGFIVTNGSGAFQEAFLTQSQNPHGQQTTLIYSTYNPANPVIRLQYVIDGDGRTNFIRYATSNAYSTNLISQVVDPFGRTNLLAYDTNGHLTNITDVAGLSSVLAYDTNDWVTNMTTPYGTHSFTITDTSGTNVAPNGRSVLVTQPDGGHRLYLYQENALGIASSYPTNQIPSTATYSNTFDINGLNLRDSFYWGPIQYAALSTNNIAGFSTNDFLKARMRHWLKSGTNAVGRTLSMQRDPSPDGAGAIEGEKEWYTYAGKTLIEYEGVQIEPLFVARVLPDGTTSFTRTERNSLGAMTREISTYSVSNSVILRTNIYLYAANGVDLIATTNALGILVSSNAYNAYHEVLTNYNALPERTVYTYDNSKRLTSITRPNGLVTTNIYGADGFLAQQIDIGFATNSYTYTNALVYTHTDPRGLTTTNTWDNLNRLTSTVFPDGTFVTNIYNKLDLVQTVERMGFTNSFGYDNMRHKIEETNALGRVISYGYCTCGSLDYIQDAAGNFTHFYYDNQGNLTNTVYADNYSITRTLNLLKQVVCTTDSSGYSVTNTYNNQGLLIGVTTAFGRVQSTVYDALDRVTNSVDANGVSITTTYDNLNRPLTRSYPDGGVEHWVYSLNVSGPTSYTNQIGNVMLYGYDAMNRKTNEVYVGVTTNAFTFDGASDLLTLTDGKSQTITWGYDSFGRVTNKVDAASITNFVYQYDADNRLTNRWTPAKGNTAYSYDAVGNMTHVAYAISPSISLAYDVLNRLTNMVDAVGTTVYSYDAVGQLLSEGGLWPNDTVSYTYTNRLRTGLSLQTPNASAWSQSYGYDSARRLTNVTSQAGTFNYTLGGASSASSLIKTLLLPNEALITNSYDSVARLLSTVLANSGGTNLDSYAYLYNQAGQRTNVVRTTGDFINYTYDNIGELKTAIGRESGGTTNRLQEQLGYTYDAAGNLSFRTNNALVQTFNVNNLNELTIITNSGTLTVAGTTTVPVTNVTVNSLTASNYADATFALGGFTITNGTNTFTAIGWDFVGNSSSNTVTVNLPGTNNYSYDLNGNLLSDGNRNFTYDDENELTNVWVTNAWQSVFVYDGKMRRRIERDYGWNGSSWAETNEIHFIYDVNLVIQERDLNNLPKVTYTRGNDLSGSLQGAGGIGGLLARTDNGQVNAGSMFAQAYYHTDGNGNVTMLIYTNQMIAAKYLYDPFGNTLSMSGLQGSANKYHFSSKEWNDNAGLYYYLYRFYDPNLQRWLNRDPINELGFKIMTHPSKASSSDMDMIVSLVIRTIEGDNTSDYVFVLNDPVLQYDSFGLDCPGCDKPPLVPASAWQNATSGDHALRCCAQHDKCFHDNTCTQSSWLLTLWKLYLQSKGIPVSFNACEQCNLNVVACMIGPDPGGDLYYCAKQGRFISIPGDFPDLPTAKKCCCTN